MNHLLKQPRVSRESKLVQQPTHIRSGVLRDLAGLIKPLTLSLTYRLAVLGRGVLHTLDRAADALKTRIAYPIVRNIREDDLVAAAASLVVIGALALVIYFLLRLM